MQKDYKKVLVSSGSKSGMDMVPSQDEYKNAFKGDTNLYQKIIKLGESNKLTCEYLILSFNTSSSVGKVAFGLVRNPKSADFPEGNCKIA